MQVCEGAIGIFKGVITLLPRVKLSCLGLKDLDLHVRVVGQSVSCLLLLMLANG